jgi:hypothetical protein
MAGGPTTLHEKFATGEFLIREANGYISRTVVSFDNTAGALPLIVEAGTVYSLEAPGTITVQAKSGNTGNGTVTAAVANPVATQLGAYAVVMTSATTFSVTAPDGSILTAGATGVPYLDGIGFRVNVGGTPYVAGDSFGVTIAIGAAPVITTGSNTGNGTLTNVEVVENAPAQPGNYVVAFTAATTFSVTAPNGARLQDGATGVPYEDQIAFTITAGGTAYAVGDGYTMGVSAGSGLVTYYTGQSPAAGVIYNTDQVPAGGTLKMTAIFHHAEVATSALRFLSSVAAAAQATALQQLAASKIFAR